MISKKTTDFWKATAIIIVVISHYFGWLVGEEHFLSTIGPFGVDIFFILSGYGLVCSASKQGISLHFVLRRIFSVYIPYLLIAGLINLIYDDLTEAAPVYWFQYFTGYDYWFMCILFVLYLVFMITYRICKNDIFRLTILTVFIILYSIRLYQLGRADFWTLSNAAFLFGVYSATLEKNRPAFFQNKRFCFILFLIFCSSSAYFCLALQKVRFVDARRAYSYELCCNLLFSAAVLFLFYLLPLRDYVLCFLGKYTLYIYLTHSVIFWELFRHLPDHIPSVLRMTIIFSATCLLSVLIGMVYNLIYRSYKREDHK